ncbi:MAG: PAS domain S-box protein [Methanomicrobiales archaeon]|nr:PAS domain S-box protein [Methanomicrobiales archaeon]
MDESLKLYDSTLNSELESAFSLFLQEYENSGRNPAAMDLGRIMHQLADRMDLFMINESGGVETLSLPDNADIIVEIWNFGEIQPPVRIECGEFDDNRIVIEPATGVLRKYAYMPTPDHRYLLELGMADRELEQQRSKFHYHDKIDLLTSLNPYVSGYRIFTSRKQLDTDKSFVPDSSLDEILDGILASRESREFFDHSNGTRIRYLFVGLKDERYGSDTSRIVEIRYDTRLHGERLAGTMLPHLLLSGGVLFLAALLSLYLSRGIIQPVLWMVKEIENDPSGRSDHPNGSKEPLVNRDNMGIFKGVSLSKQLFACMFFLVILTGGAITVADLVITEHAFSENIALLQTQTEKSLGLTLQMVDEGYKLYDDTLNEQMLEGFSIFMEEYEQSGRDISGMDLQGLKERMGASMDLNIINHSFVIEYTTFPQDLGLDFSIYPYTMNYFSEVIKKDGFYPDRVVRETSTGRYRKFAYMPSPDHQYIFELGLTGDIYRNRKGKVTFQDAIETISSLNPYITGIRSFDTTYHLVGNFSYRPDAAELDILRDSISHREDIQIEGENGTIKRYIFVEVLDPKYASDMSWIVEVSYNSQLVNSALRDVIISHGGFALIAILVSLVTAFFISKILSRPAHEIVRDVTVIADGDLDHKVKVIRGNEFEVLEQGINRMVSKLRESIEELRKREIELLDSERRFRDLVNLLPQGVFETDNEGRVTFANAYAFGMFGYPESALQAGFSVTDAVPAEERDRLKEMFRQALDGAPVSGTEFQFRRKDGHIFSGLVYSRPIEGDGKRTGLRGVVIDITLIKQAEERLRLLNEELEARVRERTAFLETANRDLESFSYSASHDLKAPLRAIDGYSGILLNQFGSQLPAEVIWYLQKIHDNVLRMNSLIDDLMHLSRMGLQKPKREQIDTTALAREVYHELELQTKERRIEFILKDLPLCSADRTLLWQVFRNLLSIAIKFTKKREVAVIEVGAFDREGSNVFYVRDNGVGFDMRYADVVFGVFQRLHPRTEYEGTGIGLAIVKRILEMHRGTIWAESGVDRGTTFYFTLG